MPFANSGELAGIFFGFVFLINCRYTDLFLGLKYTKILSKTGVRVKRRHLHLERLDFIALTYKYLVKDTETGELYEEVARGFSKALGGTWR